jgi:hypothetical protein
VALHPKRSEPALQSKTKPARFINAVHLPSFALELGRPVQKRFFAKTLWRLGITAAFLHDHGVKFLVHINPKSADGRTRPVASLITPVLPLNWQRVPSCEDNSVLLTCSITAGEPNNLPALFTCHPCDSANPTTLRKVRELRHSISNGWAADLILVRPLIFSRVSKTENFSFNL